LRDTTSIWDVAARIERIRVTRSIKERSTIPI
jgi:hypothetical protein